MLIKPTRIVVAGPQGSGKSTQAKLLAKHLGLPYICSGDLIRQEMQANTDLGRRVKEQMMRGTLLADEDVDVLVLNVLDQAHLTGWILDGYPRRMSQAIKLWQHCTPNRIIKLVLSMDNCRTRLIARGREDDSEEAITERLNEYFSETTHAINWLIRQWGYGNRYCEVIDANKTVEQVAEDILAALK